MFRHFRYWGFRVLVLVAVASQFIILISKADTPESKSNSRSESALLHEKWGQFLGRTAEIFQHNMLFLKKQVSYHLERNQFADLSVDDLNKIALKAEDLEEDDGENSGTQKNTIPDSGKFQNSKFKKDHRDDPSANLEQFLDLVGTKVGDALVGKIISMRDALDVRQNTNQQQHNSGPFDFFGAIKSNSDKMRTPLVDMIKSARGAFWEYLKDEGVVDVEKQVIERVNEVKKFRMRIDWRITKCISEPRQQSLCNSCYAISVVSLIEYYYCRKMGKLERFSPQHIVDCGQSSGMRGCKGGKLSGVGKFLQDNGLQLDSAIPYVGHERQCGLGREAHVWPQFEAWKHLPGVKTEWLKHLQKGPLLVGVGMPADFFAYAGGIHDGHNCDSNMVHAMLLVGYGIQDGKEFWVLQNSFSRDWGEDGYFRLLASAPSECFNAVIVARPAFETSKPLSTQSGWKARALK